MSRSERAAHSPWRPARLAIAVLAAAIASCGPRSPRSDGDAEEGREVLFKRLVLSLELLPAGGPGGPDAGAAIALWLIETDETGSTRRIDLGELPGPCTVARNPPGVAMKPLFALECTGGEGLRARLVYQRDHLIVLRAPGTTGDELDFEESQRIELPIGVRVLTE